MSVGNAGSTVSCLDRVDRVCVVLCLLGVALLSGELGGLTPVLDRLAVLLITVAVTILAVCRADRLRPSIDGPIVLSWVAFAFAPSGAWAIPLYLLWAIFVARRLHGDARRFPGWARGLLAIGGLYVFLAASPGTAYLLADAGAVLTRWVTRPIGGGALGAAASGLTWLGACLLALGAGGALLRSRRARWILIAVLFGFWLVHAAIQSGVTALWVRDLIKAGYVALTIGCVSGALARWTPARRRPRLRSVAAAGLPAVLLASFVLGGSTWWTTPDVTPMDVCFVDIEMLGSWQTPGDVPFGAAFSGASFGLLPRYLEAYGHRTRIVETIDAETISLSDLIVIINPGRVIQMDERDVLLTFVASGRSLVVMGDHTDIGGVMESVNAILEPTGLELRFDSAVSAQHDWRNALRLAPPLDAIHAPEDVDVSIGASVRSRASLLATPLLIGETAFSDPGDRANEENALLGNLDHDRGERYGELALAITRSYGKGRIALFGDTSEFQNVSLAHSAPYVVSAFEWIEDGPPAWSDACRALLAVALILATPVTLRVAGRYGPVLIVSILLVSTCVAHWTAVTRLRLPLPSDVGLAVVDLAHGQRVSTRALDEDSLDGLIVSLARAGYLPFALQQGPLPSLGASDLLVSVGATAALEAEEAARLERSVAEGARVIVATQWPTAAAAWPWLEDLGLTVRNVPLGLVRPTAADLDVRPQFGAAWALETSEDWVPLATVTLEERSFVVCAERRIRLGSLIVVGDVEVFHTASLETKGEYVPENLDFVRSLLSQEGG